MDSETCSPAPSLSLADACALAQRTLDYDHLVLPQRCVEQELLYLIYWAPCGEPEPPPGSAPILVDRRHGGILPLDAVTPTETRVNRYVRSVLHPRGRRLVNKGLGRLGRLRRGQEPRFPRSEGQARRVHEAWRARDDARFFRAVVTLRSGMILYDVLFDSHTLLALEVRGTPIAAFPDLLGQKPAWVKRELGGERG